MCILQLERLHNKLVSANRPSMKYQKKKFPSLQDKICARTLGKQLRSQIRILRKWWCGVTKMSYSFFRYALPMKLRFSWVEKLTDTTYDIGQTKITIVWGIAKQNMNRKLMCELEFWATKSLGLSSLKIISQLRSTLIYWITRLYCQSEILLVHFMSCLNRM